MKIDIKKFWIISLVIISNASFALDINEIVQTNDYVFSANANNVCRSHENTSKKIACYSNHSSAYKKIKKCLENNARESGSVKLRHVESFNTFAIGEVNWKNQYGGYTGWQRVELQFNQINVNNQSFLCN